MLLPDPVRSHAVLIGVHEYRHLAPLPGVQAGVGRLADLLCDPTVWGLPRRHVTVLGAEVSADRILQAVRDAGKAAAETLLVYFAGHGLREYRRKELYLALADADEDHLTIGTLPYADLVGMLRHEEFPARRRMMFLDCCYSGLATSMGGGSVAVLERYDLANLVVDMGAGQGDAGDDDDSDVIGHVMTSASGTQPSYTPGGSYPLFTGALIEVLEKGIPGAGPTLSAHSIWQHIRQQSIRSTPQYRALNARKNEPWVRNRAGEARPAVPTRRVLPAKPEPVPSPADPSGELRFTTVKGGGYRIGEVKERMKSVIAKAGDPRLGWQAVPPHFRTVSLRWTWGWDMEEVDAHVEQWRAEPKEFVDALRLLLARQGITVVPDGGPPVGRLTARFAKDAVTFTETHLCLKSPDARMSIPYSELEHVRRATSTEKVDTGVVNDQGVYPSDSIVFITHVTYGHRTLEFREGYPTPVLDALRAFQPAMSDLRERHPEWFRMVP
ncbi:caspase domain-containing protein [Streptomyces cinerochromogenes]|uniref:Caspase domain-containing protein n=1 Tax=Streptomyces cinerochromogenes TaxID=66422 RepID=A0ABW7B9Y9_9ACTN